MPRSEHMKRKHRIPVSLNLKEVEVIDKGVTLAEEETRSEFMRKASLRRARLLVVRQRGAKRGKQWAKPYAKLGVELQPKTSRRTPKVRPTEGEPADE